MCWKDFIKHFSLSVEQLTELAVYYRKLGDLALTAEDGDLELAFERYKQALLISGDRELKGKIADILARLDNKSAFDKGLRASMLRLKKGVAEFCTLLPA